MWLLTCVCVLVERLSWWCCICRLYIYLYEGCNGYCVHNLMQWNFWRLVLTDEFEIILKIAVDYRGLKLMAKTVKHQLKWATMKTWRQAVRAPLGIFQLSKRTRLDVRPSFGFYSSAEGRLIEDRYPVCRKCRKKVITEDGSTSNLLSRLRDRHTQL